MKRIANLYSQITTLENLYLADQKARRGKRHQRGVQLHDQRRMENLIDLQASLLTKTYATSPYTFFTIHEPKERQIARLPFFPDRITHHAVMNILEPIFTAHFTADTYSCIKGRGIHGAANKVRRALRDEEGTRYCLKLDIRKFYPSIDHEILKVQLRRKFKDPDLLWLLDEFIDSTEGVPIGNYLSQHFANFYLTGFDRWMKEENKAPYYFRYCDDLVILSDSKSHLHELLLEIQHYLHNNLKLAVKPNHQVFPVAARGIDFLGYKFYHTHTRLRKSIKKRFARMLNRHPNTASVNSYWGWIKHCDGQHLFKKLTNQSLTQSA